MRMGRPKKLQKIGELFDKELKDIKIKRRSTIDKDFTREISIERLTNVIPKLEEWKPLKSKLLRVLRNEELQDV